MQGKLVPIKLPPGMYKNGTRYQASGRWYDGNGVRFLAQTIRPIGGWRKLQSGDGTDLPALPGIARGAHAWRSASGALVRLAVGTHRALLAVVQGSVFDLTPTGFVAGSQDSYLSTGSGAYGAGAYGAGPYGTGAIGSTLIDADTWQLTNFGEYLVGVFTADGKLYYWDGNTSNKAVQATDSPINNRGVVVTGERFLVALGAAGDVRLVKWATQEGGISVVGDWTPSANNTAGSYRLMTKGRILAGRATKRETLIWTDADLWRMTYIGGTLVFGFDQAGDSCGLVAPNAVSVVDTRAFWMGRDAFYTYNGFVQQMNSDVRDYVYGDLNRSQLAKIWSMPIAQYGEVWWFYPSAASTEINRYVVYNWLEDHWTVGQLSRSAGFDSGATVYPIMGEPGYSAQGTLTATGNPANGDTVTIGTKTYTFQTTLTNVDGNVKIGASAAASLDNLFRAINLGAGAGTDYAAAMTRHPTVTADSETTTTLTVRATASGSGGNSIATTKTSAVLSWGATTLTGGDTSSGIRVVDLREHEVAEDRGTLVPYLESGPFELGEGDRVMELLSIVPDEKTQGDVQATLYGSMFPNDTETTYGPYSLSSPTPVRILARQLRLRFDQVRATSWRVGILRTAVKAGSKR